MASAAQPSTVYCQKCGEPMTPEDRFCRKCGCDSTVPLWSVTPPLVRVNVSDRKRAAALLLCFFLGVFGVHRFYVGKIGTGFIWLFTFGLLTFGWLYDLILITLGEFKDAEGRKLVEW